MSTPSADSVCDPVWSEPYLETCCRSAMHRLVQAAEIGRPPGLLDGACLDRLAGVDFAARRPDGRFEITEAGRARHRSEVLKRPITPGRR